MMPYSWWSWDTRIIKPAQKQVRWVSECQNSSLLNLYSWVFFTEAAASVASMVPMVLEKAPWWGGVWEQMVGITKWCFKKTISRSTLMFEQLQTVVVGVINSHLLLTYMYNNMRGVSHLLTLAHSICRRQMISYTY